MVQRDKSCLCQSCHFFKTEKTPKREEGIQLFPVTIRWHSVLWVGFGGTAVGQICAASHRPHRAAWKKISAEAAWDVGSNTWEDIPPRSALPQLLLAEKWMLGLPPCPEREESNERKGYWQDGPATAWESISLSQFSLQEPAELGATFKH